MLSPAANPQRVEYFKGSKLVDALLGPRYKGKLAKDTPIKSRAEAAKLAQELLRVEVDCDRDALRFIVRQAGPGFCHTGTTSCFGPARGLPALEAQVAARVAAAPPGSYTRRLLDDPALLQAKLREEARELAEATDRAHVAQELADVLYFALVAAGRSGVTLAEAEAVLDRRARRITRRPGDAKEDAC